MQHLDPLGRVRVPLFNPQMPFVGEGFTGAELRQAFEALPLSGRLVGVQVGFNAVPDQPGYITPMLTLRGWRVDLVDHAGRLCAMPPAPTEGADSVLSDRRYVELEFIGMLLSGLPIERQAEELYAEMRHSQHGVVKPVKPGAHPEAPVWRLAVCNFITHFLIETFR